MTNKLVDLFAVAAMVCYEQLETTALHAHPSEDDTCKARETLPARWSETACTTGSQRLHYRWHCGRPIPS